MGRFCTSQGGRATRLLGLALMAAGAAVLLLSAPRWLWLTLLGALLASLGYLVWRFL